MKDKVDILFEIKLQNCDNARVSLNASFVYLGGFLCMSKDGKLNNDAFR